MNKRGQGLSLTTIVVAAIALLVLVILSVVFIGRMGGFAGQVSECENKGGTCRTIDAGCSAGESEYSAWNCPTEEDEIPEICCVPIQ